MIGCRLLAIVSVGALAALESPVVKVTAKVILQTTFPVCTVGNITSKISGTPKGVYSPISKQQ